MNTHTITITEEQRQVVAKALDRLSQLWLGQTGAERDTAKKLLAGIEKCRKEYNNDLTQL